MKKIFRMICNLFLAIKHFIDEWVYNKPHAYSDINCTKTKCRFMMVILTPLKLIYMFAYFLERSRIVYRLLVAAGVTSATYILYTWITPFDSKWKVAFALMYLVVGIILEIAIIEYVWEKICSVFIAITHYGSFLYDGYRNKARRISGDYKIGLDEESRVGLNYFIHKEKKYAQITYISD